jgi:hypothetical protein
MLAALAAVVQLADIQPRQAPPVYATHNYALTFHSPPSATYCPLPDGWVGSDHGTTLFLVPPNHCGGAGYPSTSRGFSPPDIPRIEVFYSFAIDDSPSAPKCHPNGSIQFVGAVRVLCQGREGRLTTLAVSARYDAGEPAGASLRLVTTPRRLAADRRVLERLALSFRPCRVLDASPRFGTGAPCPDAPWF